MSDPIDREELKKIYQNRIEYLLSEINEPALAGAVKGCMDIADTLPSMDVVQIIRCKDCKYCEINDNHPDKPLICTMTLMCGTTEPENYCWQGISQNEKGK